MANPSEPDKYHDLGEQDAAKGEYHQPHGVFDHFFQPDAEGQQKENDAYDKGWKNTTEQLKNNR